MSGGNSRAITIQPTGINEYAPLRWLDQEGNNIGQIVCHEKNSKWDLHNHCTWYTALKDRKKRTGRVDLTFGEDFANWTFESVWINFEKEAYIKPVLKSPNGSLFKLHVDDLGNLSSYKIR